ncbi:CPXCG motif-containing cysteine-rich protein [Tenacibaculum xiamenense]|uniref:CPXCG motif-containing cysteine-rich protein n=1 Tax=Tenacibaculum xiamenense TaxID=1261553 RepID=UPI0038B68F0E
MIEHFFQCPYCWQQISMLIDSSIEHQSYIEDCENCCNPMQINASFINSELVTFSVNQDF